MSLPQADQEEDEPADIEISTEQETHIIDCVKPEETVIQQNPLTDYDDLTILEEVDEKTYTIDYQGPSNKRPKIEEIEATDFCIKQDTSPSHVSERDEHDVFGEYVSGKLRTFDHKTKCMVQYLMANVLFQADMGKFKGENVDCEEIMSSLLALFNKKCNNSKIVF